MDLDAPKLDKRHGEILAAVVRLFVATGVPAGSKAVADKLEELWSSATVRNVMSELEDLGYLSQPHISAGRIPTDRAYRYYVDWLAESPRLSRELAQSIEESLGRGGDLPEQLMARTCSVLAEITSNVGVVLGPPLEEKLIEHIKFVKLPDRRVLAVIVSKPDLIENKVIVLEDEFTQDELDRTAEFLSAEFRGWSLRAIRVEIFKRLEHMKTLCDSLVSTVAVLFERGALGGEEEGRLFVDGTETLVGQPEFADSNAIRGLLRAFEDKVKLIKILSACLETPSGGVVTVIGCENPASEMKNCTVIVAPYRYRNRVVGALGVVGPTRLQYDRAISTVDYIAHLCSRLLSSS